MLMCLSKTTESKTFQIFTKSRLATKKLSISEDDLIALLRQKDRKAYMILYDNYGSALFGVIMKVIKVSEIAQDVLQDTFVKIWSKIDSYDKSKGTLFTWMLNVARNTAIDKIRSSEFKQFAYSDAFENKVVDSKISDKPDIDTIGLTQLVHGLSNEQQEVIDMIYFQGYSHSETAEVLKLPLGTVKTRIRIALRELRKFFKL
jgi:RNA polymerase sigma-70 factor, ECF subfamily